MLIKWMSKKVVENLINEAIKQLPELKDRLIADLMAHKDEFIKSAIDYIKSAIIDFLKNR